MHVFASGEVPINPVLTCSASLNRFDLFKRTTMYFGGTNHCICTRNKIIFLPMFHSHASSKFILFK